MERIIATAINWIFASSADPSRVSLSVRMALLGVIPWTMQAIGIACALDTICIDLDQSALEAVVDYTAQLVFYGLTLVSTVGLIYGVVRKIYRTVTGGNGALH